MMMREIVVKTGLLSVTLLVAGLLVSPTTSHAESKKGGLFGKAYEQDWTPEGGDPTKGPGMLDAATLRIGNTVIKTGRQAEGQGTSGAYSAERARKARALQNRSIDATTPN